MTAAVQIFISDRGLLVKRFRSSFWLASALIIGLVAVACGTSTVSNPATQPTATATASSSSAAPGDTTSSEPSASESASSETTPEASSSATPKVSAATPGPSASGPTTPCAGGSDPSFFVTATNGLPFDVYCPVLPATWFVDAGGGEWRGGNDQWLQISYKGPSGAKISLQEGAFCTGGLSLCSSHDSVIGPASFGDLQGTLDALGPTPSFGYAIYIDPGTRKGYTITGVGLTQDAFKAIAAALLKVPKG